MQLFDPILPGAKIGVIALGSPLSVQRETLGLAGLKSCGYQAVMPLETSKYYADYTHGFANGSAQERLNALKTLLADDSVEAILSARGGYGVMELLESLNSEWLTKATKPIIGLSDLTVLLAQKLNGFAPAMIHGPSLGDAFADFENDEQAKASVNSLLKLFQQRPYSASFNLSEIRHGQADGKLLVGNLSMFCSLLGTPFDVSFDNCVVVFEDVAEPPYLVHRNLVQLSLASKFDNVAGVVFGRFAKCSAAHGPDIDSVIKSIVANTWGKHKFPVLSGIPVGHWGENQALPIGANVLVNKGQITISA